MLSLELIQKVEINNEILKIIMSVFLMKQSQIAAYKYMKSPRNDVLHFSGNTHVRIKIYREFYHCIIYIANEGYHFRIYDIYEL